MVSAHTIRRAARWATFLLLASAHAALASRLGPPEWSVMLEGVRSSDLFLDYVTTTADRGVRAETAVGTATRLGKSVKLGLGGNAGGVAYARFHEANYGWLGGELSARRGGSRWIATGEWIPRRVKFPATPENASYSRFEWSIGLRQVLPRKLRLRAQVGIQRDDYVESFRDRDGDSRTLLTRLEWRPVEALAFHAQADWDVNDARAPKFDYREHDARGGLVWSRAAWELGAAVTSGLRRYAHARLVDSNYRRRDQWIEPELALTRRFGGDLAARAGFTLRHQTSSRLDRAYTASTLRLGLTWTPTQP